MNQIETYLVIYSMSPELRVGLLLNLELLTSLIREIKSVASMYLRNLFHINLYILNIT